MKKQLILGAALILVLAGCGQSGQEQSQGETLSPEKAKTKAKSFIENNLMAQSQSEVQVSEVTEEKGLYKIGVQAGNQNIDSYMTKDGEIFFPRGMDMDNPQQSSAQGNRSTSTPQQPQMSTEERAKAIVPQMEQLLNQQGDSISEEERQKINDKMDELKQLNEQEDPDSGELETKIQELQKVSQPLIQQMMKQQQGGQGSAQPAPQGGAQN